jgi:RNA polymerase sigma-70 factor (ECF subfamily)
LQAQRNELIAAMHSFLDNLQDTERRIFLLRYWYLEPIQSIANQYGFTQSKVASMLQRIRGKLRRQLEKEGYV